MFRSKSNLNLNQPLSSAADTGILTDLTVAVPVPPVPILGSSNQDLNSIIIFGLDSPTKSVTGAGVEGGTMTGSAGGVLIKPRPNSGKVSPATTMTMGDQNMSREGSRGATAAPSSAGYHRPTSYYTAPTSPPPASEPVGPSSASIFKSSLDEIMILPRSSSLPFSLSATARASSDRYASPQPLAANSQKHRSIASLYPSPSSSSATLPTSISLPNVRKSLKAPVRFNVVVMGARETGKTAMIRTILETLQFQKATAATMQSKVADFVGKATTATKPTTREQEISIDCVVAAGEKINLNIIDTVGLEVPFSVGRGGDELEVYRQIGAMVKNVEERFEQTLVEESSTIRQSRPADAQIHLILYLVHPASFSASTATSSLSSRQSDSFSAVKKQGTTVEALQSSSRTSPTSQFHSHVFPSPPLPKTAPIEESDYTNDVNSSGTRLVMQDVDLKAIQRLSRCANILPVLARCDELTETQLSSLKSVMRANLSTAGIQLSPWDDEEGDEEEEEEEETYDDILPFAIMSPETFAVSTDRGQHRFVRKFRYGEADVLNSDHCDFTSLTEAIFDKMNVLRETTKMKKYEAFRTNRLLLKRATMSEATRKDLLAI